MIHVQLKISCILFKISCFYVEGKLVIVNCLIKIMRVIYNF